MQVEDYHVQLPVFEGPLDLLLYLIRRDEIDIYDIPIEYVTRQYNEYLKLMEELDLDVAGEFIVMSATLMLIKSRMLLPEERRGEEDDEEEDPRLDLVRQLIEYRKFKDVADHLEDLEEEQADVFGRGDAGIQLGADSGFILQGVNIFDLISALNRALEKAKPETIPEIYTDTFTVNQQIEWMVTKLKQSTSLSLNELFEGMESRQQIICTFLATLELIRLCKVSARQTEEDFGDIILTPLNDLSEEERPLNTEENNAAEYE